MPFGLPAFEWMLELGAFMLNSETELILKSRRVIATKLMQSGFEFQFPNWTEAARDLCARVARTGRVIEVTTSQLIFSPGLCGSQ